MDSLHGPSWVFMVHHWFIASTPSQYWTLKFPSSCKPPCFGPILVFRGGGGGVYWNSSSQPSYPTKKSSHVTWKSAFQSSIRPLFATIMEVENGYLQTIHSSSTIYTLNHDSWEERCKQNQQKNRHKTMYPTETEFNPAPPGHVHNHWLWTVDRSVTSAPGQKSSR